MYVLVYKADQVSQTVYIVIYEFRVSCTYSFVLVRTDQDGETAGLTTAFPIYRVCVFYCVYEYM